MCIIKQADWKNKLIWFSITMILLSLIHLDIFQIIKSINLWSNKPFLQKWKCKNCNTNTFDCTIWSGKHKTAMIYQLMNKTVYGVMMMKRWKRFRDIYYTVSGLTIAKVVLLSVSIRSEAASILCALSNSLRFFFIFSRCMSDRDA